MIVLVYSDGSTLTCDTIQICGSDFYCDDYRIVPICDIDRIEYEERSEE